MDTNCASVLPNDIGFALRNKQSLVTLIVGVFCWNVGSHFKFLGRQHLQDDEYDSEKRFGCFEYSQLLGGIFVVGEKLFSATEAGGVKLGRLTQPLNT